MFDLSAEDTPLSVRQSNSGSKKGKRLKLYQGDNDSRELQCEEGSSTEFEDSHEKPKRRTRFCEGSESEKQDESGEGIRRSTRKRKLVYGPCNTSWILGGQTARVKETFTLFCILLQRILIKLTIHKSLRAIQLLKKMMRKKKGKEGV